MTFLDVGTGDAILIRAPGNHNMLIDGGGTYDGRFDIGARVIAPVLWNQFIRDFDLMAITHPQANHARGVASLIQRFPTRHLLTNGSPHDAAYLQRAFDIAYNDGMQYHTALTGPRHWRWGDLSLHVLSPPSLRQQQHSRWHPRTENDRSLVLRLQYGRVRILLTGDIQAATEKWLVQQGVDLRADILQIPHHGSKTSTTLSFVKHVNPKVAIISLGAHSRYGHPHQRVLDVLQQQGIKVFRTDRHGAVTITTNGLHFHLNTQQEN